MKTNFSHPVLIVFAAISLILSACGSVAPAATATAMPSATATNTAAPTLTPTVTWTPTRTPKPTATPNLTATQQYNDFMAVVQRAHDAGQIATMEGKYVELADYQDEMASKLSYSWGDTGVSAKNFIVQADFYWSTAIKTTNLSGCGFVYRIQSNKDHYLILLDSYAGVKLASSTDRGTYSMGSPSNGDRKIASYGVGPYRAKFTMVVNDLKTYVYVNDDYYGEYDLLEFRINESGPFAGAVLSATESGYGTRCSITNMQAWIIE